MHKKSKIKKSLISAVFFAGMVFLFGLGSAQAKTVTDGNFRITYNDPLFAVTNAAPGESFSSDMLIENLGGRDRKFQFELDMTANPKALADRLFLRIDDTTGGGQVCEFGCANNKTIGSLGRTEFVIKTIPGDGAKNFRFSLTFDPTAGNEFQNTFISFDIKLGFKDEVTGTTGGGGGGAVGGPGAVVGGTGPTGVIGGAVLGTAGGIVGGAETGVIGEQPGQVQGEETSPGIVEGDQISICQSWPKWVWVLLLIAYFVAFLWRTFSNLSEQIEKRDIRWGWQAVLAAAAFLVWYFFDKCREFWWFVIIAIVGGAVIYLLYLYLFRKNIRDEYGDIKSGSGEEPPENPEPPQAPTSSEE